MSCKDTLEQYLRENKVPYQMQHHPRAFTAQEVAASEHVPGEFMAKVVMVIADGKLTMLVLPAPMHVHLPAVAEALGAKEVRLAQEQEFAGTFPSCDVGAMPPFGNLYGIPVYVDRSLAEDEVIFFQCGSHTDTISVPYVDYEWLVQPRVASFTLEDALYYTS